MKIYERMAHTGKIEKRDDCFAVRYRSIYGGDAVKTFETKNDAESFINLGFVEYEDPKPNKRKKIKIVEGSIRHDEEWTERKTGEKITEEKIYGYHFGFHGKNLKDTKTCFYFDWPSEKNFVPEGTIIVEIPEGTKIDVYDDEFRCELQKNWNAWKVNTGWLTSK